MRKFELHIYDNNKIQIQRADYIEDGWFITVEGNKFELYEIPLYGGEEELIGEYDSLIVAIEEAEKLT